jgi:hypothetical protein
VRRDRRRRRGDWEPILRRVIDAAFESPYTDGRQREPAEQRIMYASLRTRLDLLLGYAQHMAAE